MCVSWILCEELLDPGPSDKHECENVQDEKATQLYLHESMYLYVIGMQRRPCASKCSITLQYYE